MLPPTANKYTAPLYRLSEYNELTLKGQGSGIEGLAYFVYSSINTSTKSGKKSSPFFT